MAEWSARQETPKINMDRSNEREEIKTLSLSELESVSGGMVTEMRFGADRIVIWASAKDHCVLKVPG